MLEQDTKIDVVDHNHGDRYRATDSLLAHEIPPRDTFGQMQKREISIALTPTRTFPRSETLESKYEGEVNATLTTKDIYKRVLALSAPFAGALLISMAGDFIVGKGIAQLGSVELAASGLIGSSQSLLIGPVNSFISVISIFAGSEKGGQDKSQVGKVYRQGLLLAGFLSIPLIILTLLIEPILISLNQSSEHAKLVADYFNARVIGIPFTLGLTVNQQISIGISKNIIATISTISSTVLATAFGYALIVGELGMPEMGLQGWGYAISGANIFNFLATTLYLNFSKEFSEYDFFSWDFRVSLSQIKILVKKGIPIGIQTWIDSASLSIPLLFAGWKGESSLVAQQIVTLYYYLFATPCSAASLGITGLIAENHRKGSVDYIKRYGNSTFLLCLLISSSGLILFCTTPQFLSSFFINVDDPKNSETVSLVNSLFIVHGIELMFDAVRTVSTGLLRSHKDTYFPLWTSIITTALCLSIGYALGFPAGIGTNGIYIGRDIGLTVGATLLYRRWLTKLSSSMPDPLAQNRERNLKLTPYREISHATLLPPPQQSNQTGSEQDDPHSQLSLAP